MQEYILLVDDEETILNALQRTLSEININVKTALNGAAALEMIKAEVPAVVVTDLRMPVMGGIELLEQLHKDYPSIQVVVITGHGTVEDAVQAMKLGAYDFISKPFKKQDIVPVLKRALEKVQLLQENARLKEQLRKNKGSDFAAGKSQVMRELFLRGAQAARSDATILITGESGTGKEVLANHIFENSSRSHQSFIKVNCAAIPENLLEAELFGYRKGAFTGAYQDRKGKFDDADGGTLFLDEIGELPLTLQPKLLRVLQEGQIDPIGGKPKKVDVRILAATNKDLRKKVEEGAFREDLFYRLNVIPLRIPPLRERSEDLPALLSFFLVKFCEKNKRTMMKISPEAMRMIETYPWPGNVRELENAVERSVILALSDQITPDDLPPELGDPIREGMPLNFAKGLTLEEIEMQVIHSVMKKYNGDKVKTAKELGISLRTIYRKLNPKDLEAFGITEKDLTAI